MKNIYKELSAVKSLDVFRSARTGSGRWRPLKEAHMKNADEIGRIRKD